MKIVKIRIAIEEGGKEIDNYDFSGPVASYTELQDVVDDIESFFQDEYEIEESFPEYPTNTPEKDSRSEHDSTL
jgi:hypothetical protein